MKIFLSVKYQADMRNRGHIEHLLDVLEACGHDTFCVVRDIEKWGALHFDEVELMHRTLMHLRESHMVLVEISEKGVGIGIEAGYAHARGIDLVAIARKGREISATLLGIARNSYYYLSFEDLREFITQLEET